MANTTNSIYMALPVPVVGVDPGPQWATDVNSCFTIVDQHDHTPGYGVQITPNGLNINGNLPFNNNNAITIRSLRFQSQAAVLALAADLGCLYAVGADLYFNDGSGNKIRITQSGAVAGTPGSIANLVSPAAAAYVNANQTFVFQSAANTPANLDGGSLILRNVTANSKGLTLSPPNAMGSNYSVTLPALPPANAFVTIDSSGNQASTIPTSLGIATANIADAAITKPKLAALGQQLSASSGAFSDSSGAAVDITNLTITITTTGRPVELRLVGDTSGVPAIAASGVASSTTAHTIGPAIAFIRGSTTVAILGGYTAQSTALSEVISAGFPPSSFSHQDAVAAGTYTYKVQIAPVTSGTFTSTTVSATSVKLLAYEQS